MERPVGIRGATRLHLLRRHGLRAPQVLHLRAQVADLRPGEQASDAESSPRTHWYWRCLSHLLPSHRQALPTQATTPPPPTHTHTVPAPPHLLPHAPRLLARLGELLELALVEVAHHRQLAGGLQRLLGKARLLAVCSRQVVLQRLCPRLQRSVLQAAAAAGACRRSWWRWVEGHRAEGRGGRQTGAGCSREASVRHLRALHRAVLQFLGIA